MAETTIGDAAASALEQVCERMQFWQMLGKAAGTARAIGAQIFVRENGFIVFRGSKSEVIPFENADEAMLLRSIERVAE
jgi:hypothetical protein